jgi:transposase-like protein
VIPFFAFPPDAWRIIYATNAMERLNGRPCKIVTPRGRFPSDEAATKSIWRALRNITTPWRHATRDWKAAINRFAIAYGDRFTHARG